jgi:hypothetical protein
MRGWAGLAVLLTVGACGGGEDANVTAGRIEALASGNKALPADLVIQLTPLSLEDLEREEMTGAGCSFHVGEGNGQTLFAGDPAAAVARIGGRIVRFTTSGPLEPSGGFFESGTVSVSVGRIAGDETPIEEGVIVPARMALINRGTGVRHMVDGRWICGA